MITAICLLALVLLIGVVVFLASSAERVGTEAQKTLDGLTDEQFAAALERLAAKRREG